MNSVSTNSMRPYVIINAAMSADGKISTPLRRQTKISGTEDFARMEKLRAESDAVLVGIGTVRADNPSLRLKNEALKTERLEKGLPAEPARVVVDSRAEFPDDSDMFIKGSGRIIVAVSEAADKARVEALSKRVTVVTAGKTSVDMALLLDKLGELGIRQLMIEGGASILWSVMSQRLFDEIRIYVGAVIIGGKTSPTFADGEGFTSPDDFPRLTLKSAERFDDRILLTWLKKE